MSILLCCTIYGTLGSACYGNNIDEDVITDKNACIIVKYIGEIPNSIAIDGIKLRVKLSDNMELIELSMPEHKLGIMEKFELLPDVEYAQPNYIMHTAEVDINQLQEQWALDNTSSNNKIDINVLAAWNLGQGIETVNVGILDTYIDIGHCNLSNAIKNNGCNYCGAVNSGDVLANKHGTGIAGVIAAQGNGGSIVGVAKNIKITPLGFIKGNKGYTSDAILAIQHAKKENIKIVNCSFGSDDYNPALYDIMQDNSDVLFVCAAGNNGRNTDANPYYPASFDLPNIISVGSVDFEGKISAFSNYGFNVDVLAPGEEILSTSTNNGHYTFSGTSMSAAYVTGVAALVKSYYYNISASELANRIIDTVKKYPDYAEKVNAGGIVDAYAAITGNAQAEAVEYLFEDSVDNIDEEIAGAISPYSINNGVMDVSTNGEIDPIKAQLIHYGESGINPASGNFSFVVNDFIDDAPGGEFVFSRYYNSLDQSDDKAFGRGWSSMLDSKIYIRNSRDAELQLTMPNGSTHTYELVNGIYSSITTRNKLTKDNDNQYTLTTPENVKYIFTKSSLSYLYPLTGIKDKMSNFTTQICYSSSGTYILDSAGRKYKIKYGDYSTVKSITDPYGRVTYYNCFENETPWGMPPFMLLSSWTDINGVKNVMSFCQKDGRFWANGEVDGGFPYTDTFLDSLSAYEPGGESRNIISLEYNLDSYDPDYGKVIQYTDEYNETYSYSYGYMKTDITRDNDPNPITEYYDSFMYILERNLVRDVNEPTQWEYYRPDGKNYGEVVQEKIGDGRRCETITYIRDPETGKVLKVINPDGSQVEYWYDDRNNVIGELDEDAHCILYVYDDSNRLIKKANYSNNGFPDIGELSVEAYITQNNEDFITESYTYFDDGNNYCYNALIEKIIDAEGNIVSFEYDKYGNLISKSRPYVAGETVHKENYEYSVNYIDSSNVSAAIKTKPYIAYVDESQENMYMIGRRTKKTSPMGVSVISYTDNNGMEYKKETTDSDDAEITRTVYDYCGRKLKEISADAYAENQCALFETISSSVIDSKKYYYIDFVDGSGEYKYATEYKYINNNGPGHNEIESITYPEVNGERAIKSFEYERNLVKKVTNPDGQYLTYSYDELDRQIREKFHITTITGKNYNFGIKDRTYAYNSQKGFGISDAIYSSAVVNTAKKYEETHDEIKYYNYKNNLVYNYIAAGGETSYYDYVNITNNIYNADGTMSKSYNSYGNLTYYVYDNMGRVIETWEAIDSYNGNTYFRYEKKDYYKNGNVKTEYTCKEPVKVPVDTQDNIIPSSDVYRTLIKKDGESTNQSDYVVVNYTYYPDGNIKTELSSNGSLIEYEYDLDGNLCQEIKNGVKICYANTYLGQQEYMYEYMNPQNVELTEDDVYQNTGNSVVLTTQHKYENGLLTEVVEPTGTQIIYEADERGRRVAESREGEFVNHAGETVRGIYRISKKLDWENKPTEETVEEIVNGVSTVIYKKIYFPKVDKTYHVSYSNYVILFEQKVQEISYDAVTGAETVRTSLYYMDYYGKVIIEISPNDYIEGGTVSYGSLYKDTFVDSETEMNRTEYEYDWRGNIKREIRRYRDPENNYEWKKVDVHTYKYDENGNLIEHIDAMGNSTKTRYNLDNKVFLVQDPVSQENKYSYSEKYEYDALGRVVKKSDADKNDTIYEYDDVQNTVNEISFVTNADGVNETINRYNKYDYNNNLIETYINDIAKKHTYCYNERNMLISDNPPSDTTVDDGAVSIKYDSVGNISRKTIGDRRLEHYSYDDFGNQTVVTVSNPDGSNAITTRKKYDSRGNVRFEIDGNQNVIEHKYDGFGQQTEVKDIHSTYYNYDANGNLISETDWRGNVNRMTYDALNRVVKKINADNIVYETLHYNDNGLQIKSVDAMGQETTFTYDKNNRLLSTTDPAGHTTGKTYTRSGYVATEYDGNNNITDYDYDQLGRLIRTRQTVDGEEEVIKFTYDGYGNMLSQTNGKGHTTSYTYNAVNLMSSKIDHEGEGVAEKTESYKYDGRGNIIEKTDRNGTTLNYVYDAHNRLSQIKQGDDVLISRTYDANGNTLEMTDESGTTTATYDSLNRVLSKNVPNMGTSTYQYDITDGFAQGNVAEKVTDPNQNVTITVFDKTNRIYQVKDSENSTAVTYEYYPNGAQQKATYPNGSNTEYTYNADGTLQGMLNKKADNTVMDSYTYIYDSAKNQISKSEVINGIDKGTTTYTYDELNRLKTVTEPSGKTTAYEYDKAGNRAKETVTEGENTVVTTYTYNEQERLMEEVCTENAVVTTYSYQYDNNGNLYSKIRSVVSPDGDGEESLEIAIIGEDADPELGAIYEYDALNRLKTVYQGENTIVNTYNGDGLRTSKAVNGAVQYYLYEDGKIVLEEDGNGTETARNIYGIYLLSRETADGDYTYRFNGHGDVIALTDSTGTVVASYYYDPFGVITEETGEVINPFRYVGEFYDVETGMVYLRARYYDPSIGRFISEDPIRDGYNWYVYCSNNPIRYVDYLGLFSSGDTLKMGSSATEDIKLLQDALVYLGHMTEEEKSTGYGIFGPRTLRAVNAFKTEMGLGNSGEYEGVVGEQTWRYLNLDIEDVVINDSSFNDEFKLLKSKVQEDYWIQVYIPDGRWKEIKDALTKERNNIIDAGNYYRVPPEMIASIIIKEVITRSAPDELFFIQKEFSANHSFGIGAINPISIGVEAWENVDEQYFNQIRTNFTVNRYEDMAYSLYVNDYFSVNSIAVVLKYLGQKHFEKNPVVLTNEQRKEILSAYNSGELNGAPNYARITHGYMDIARDILYYPDN